MGRFRSFATGRIRPNPDVRRFRLQWQGREDEEPSFCPRAPGSKWTADRIGLRVCYRLKAVDWCLAIFRKTSNTAFPENAFA